MVDSGQNNNGVSQTAVAEEPVVDGELFFDGLMFAVYNTASNDKCAEYMAGRENNRSGDGLNLSGT